MGTVCIRWTEWPTNQKNNPVIVRSLINYILDHPNPVLNEKHSLDTQHGYKFTDQWELQSVGCFPVQCWHLAHREILAWSVPRGRLPRQLAPVRKGLVLTAHGCHPLQTDPSCIGLGDELTGVLHRSMGVGILEQDATVLSRRQITLAQVSYIHSHSEELCPRPHYFNGLRMAVLVHKEPKVAAHIYSTIGT